MAGPKGFSFREHILGQGVTEEEAIRGHIRFAFMLSTANPSLDLSKYKVRIDCNTPPYIPEMG